MEAQKLQLFAQVFTNQELQARIQKLENQILEEQAQGQTGSPEYQFDQLVLKSEQIELKMQEDHPDINPLTAQGHADLEALLAKDPQYQALQQQALDLVRAYYPGSSGWLNSVTPTNGHFIPVSAP